MPLGKLATERMVPLDPATLAVVDAWVAGRVRQRAQPHPKTARPTDFLFTERGRRLSPARVRSGLAAAVRSAGLTDPGGAPLRVTPHQLRHTYATELANAGMSLPALMALLGHVTPEMTLRYATLASPTLRAGYDRAIGTLRRSLPVVPAGRPIIPERVAWIASEFLKTRVATGFCSRHLAAEACPYANVCETCENFLPAAEFAPALRTQLVDIRELRADAERRGRRNEVERTGGSSRASRITFGDSKTHRLRRALSTCPRWPVNREPLRRAAAADRRREALQESRQRHDAHLARAAGR